MAKHTAPESIPAEDDLGRYLRTKDAQLAPLWQIVTLGMCRRVLGRALSDLEYRHMRRRLNLELA